jgi:tRNA threonylcarbamoyladenosine biosynthesis protein TsaE
MAFVVTLVCMTELRGYTCTSPDDTQRAGAALARCLRPGDLLGLVGDLGAGKTLMIQGIARGLAVPPEMRVTSPTFTLVNEYHGGSIPLYHADLYRIERAAELDELGLDEICRRGDGVVCVEWCDRFPVLGRDYLEIRFEVSGASERRLSATGHGARSRAVLADWAAALQKK